METLANTPRETLDAIVLMVSELTSNCIRFTSSDFSVNIEDVPPRIRVEVTDGGGGVPMVRSPQPEDLSGRGLLIVQAMSDDWGITSPTTRPGKTVWFTVDRTRSPARP